MSSGLRVHASMVSLRSELTNCQLATLYAFPVPIMSHQSKMFLRVHLTTTAPERIEYEKHGAVGQFPSQALLQTLPAAPQKEICCVAFQSAEIAGLRSVKFANLIF
jgi:hypothetical protein